jgi:hypothetical protein
MMSYYLNVHFQGQRVKLLIRSIRKVSVWVYKEQPDYRRSMLSGATQQHNGSVGKSSTRVCAIQFWRLLNHESLPVTAIMKHASFTVCASSSRSGFLLSKHVLNRLTCLQQLSDNLFTSSTDISPYITKHHLRIYQHVPRQTNRTYSTCMSHFSDIWDSHWNEY